jgi:hypothetical protein
MAEKASGKAQGRSRPQTQAKNQNRSGQQKRNPDAGRGGSGGGGGARGAANGTAAQKTAGRGDERSQQKGKAREAQDQQGGGREEQEQDESRQAASGNGGAVGDKIKQYPITAAALGAGLTLLAAQGLRMAIGGGQSAGGGASDAFGSEEDQDEDQGEDDGGARGASASSEVDEGEEGDEDQGGEESGLTGRLSRLGSKVGSAFRGSGNAIRRGAESGFERGRQGAGEAWHSHPLFICGAALAAGAAAGFLLPSTRQEDRLIGKTSDKVAGRFKKAGTDFFRQGRSIAGKALNEAVNTAASEAEREGLTPNRLGKKFKRVFGNVRDAVAESIQED